MVHSQSEQRSPSPAKRPGFTRKPMKSKVDLLSSIQAKSSASVASLSFVALSLLFFSQPLLAQSTFVPSQPGVSSTTPSTSTLPIQAGTNTVILLGNGKASLPGIKYRSRSCYEVYGAPAAGVAYLGGPIVEYQYLLSPGAYSAWTLQSGACVREITQTQTIATCPSGQAGSTVQKRIYTLNDAGGTIQDTGFLTQSSTCASFSSGTQTETQTLPCTNGSPGTYVQSRTYDVWSDGTNRNYTNWTTTSSSCNQPFKTGVGYNQTTSACSSGQSGEIISRQSYDIWSDGTTQNYSAWFVAGNSCVALGVASPTLVKYVTETQTQNDCASGQAGSNTYQRQYALYSDGNHYSYTNWAVVSSTCAYQYISTQTENSSRNCSDANPAWTGPIWTQRTYEVWSDGSYRNYSGWYDTGNACSTYFVQTVWQDSSRACSDQFPAYAGPIFTQRHYDVYSDGSVQNDSGWYDTGNACYTYQVGWGSMQSWGGAGDCAAIYGDQGPEGQGWAGYVIWQVDYQVYSDGSAQYFGSWYPVNWSCWSYCGSNQGGDNGGGWVCGGGNG